MNHLLKNRLGGKPLLLMDDEYFSVGDYQLRLNDIGVSSEHVETLDEALALIQAKPNGYGLALLDLRMPEAKSQILRAYAGELHLNPTSYNHGRCLGLHLWNERATLKLPYCYISALLHFYGPSHVEFAGREADFILDKAALLPSELPDRLVDVLTKWDALPSLNGKVQAGVQP